MEPDNLDAITYMIFILRRLGEPSSALHSLYMKGLKVSFSYILS